MLTTCLLQWDIKIKKKVSLCSLLLQRYRGQNYESPVCKIYFKKTNKQ